MYKVLFSLFLSVTLISSSQAQSSIAEPEFIGGSILVKPDSSTFNLDKTLAQVRLLHLYYYIKRQLEIVGCCSNLKVSSADLSKSAFVVRAKDNQSDPMYF